MAHAARWLVATAMDGIQVFVPENRAFVEKLLKALREVREVNGDRVQVRWERAATALPLCGT